MAEVVNAVVVRFDPTVGLGAVEVDGTAHPFHATAIAGGSRMVAVGAEVVVVLEPGHGGQYWATSVLEP